MHGRERFGRVVFVRQTVKSFHDGACDRTGGKESKKFKMCFSVEFYQRVSLIFDNIRFMTVCLPP